MPDRLLPLVCALLAALVAIGSPSYAAARGAVFVSPNGDDGADGRTLKTAFRTLERAGTAVGRGHADTVYLGSGTFRSVKDFTLPVTRRPQRWMAVPGARPVIDGGGRTGTALIVTGQDVVIEGLAIANYRGNGIVVGGGAANVTIANNSLRNIASFGWTQAAIMAIESATNVTVEGNRITDTGYVGIGFFASENGNIAGARIRDNSVENTCRAVADCGAIYVGGRSPSAYGAVIEGNRVRNFGPSNKQSRAIYLDDGLSNARVVRNTIDGPGSWVFHIHGGSGNIIAQNTVTLEPRQTLLFHQKRGSRAMRGNRFSGNIVRHPAGPLPAVQYGGTSTGLDLRDNRYIAY